MRHLQADAAPDGALDTGVLASATTGAARFFVENGGDPDGIFGNAGLDPAASADPTRNIKLSAYCRLFETAARITGNDNIGLWFGQQFQPVELGLLGYVSIHSPTMQAALGNLVGLFPFHQQGTEMSLSRTRDLLSLNYRIFDSRIVNRRQDAELSLGMFCNIFRHCYGPGWTPEEIHFEHPKPADWQEHEQAFGAPAFFGQRANAIVFRDQGLDRPMRTSDPRLLMILRRCLKTVGIQPGTPRTMAEQIKDHLLKELPDGCPNLEDTSEALGVPAWTIQRRLADMGLTFKELVEDTRRQLAEAYLKQPHLPLTEIAFLLGYSELSAFSRAFHRWTGLSPREYRQTQLS